jgi:TolA-binding protein
MRPLLIAGLLLAGTAAPALAQEAGVPQRIDRLEREMRAVQRKVFPGGNQQYLEPQIGGPPPAAPAPSESGATSPVADLTARVSSLEQELARLTGQIEQDGFRIRQIDEQFARFKADAEFRLNTLEGNTPAAGATSPGGAAGAAALGAAAGAAAGAVTAPPAPTRAAPPAAPAPFGPAGRAPLAAPPAAPAEPAPVVSSGDPGEDAYLAGYRRWEQKKYTEAEAALKAVVDKYPKHRRASYAQNLLGRAFLDDGQPAKAAEAFYANYQKMPRGERAPDSLYYLGQALMALKPPKSADACKVYAELLDVYGEKIAQPLKDRVAKGRADAKCGA